MKYSCWLSVFILVLSANAYALHPKIEITEQFDNLKMIAFIGEEDINDNPEWNPGINAPPLTVIEAIQAVNDFNKKPIKPGDIREIEIRPVPKHEKYWHYLIKIANDEMKSMYSVYVVLMNGKVIPAIIEPQSYK